MRPVGWRLGSVVAFVTLFLTSACADPPVGAGPLRTTAPEPTWRAVPDGPLTPREGTLGLWTGREVLLLGGTDGPPCPPGAGCIAPSAPPLASGAAFNPTTGQWRPIADAPTPVAWAHGAVLGDTAYVLTQAYPASNTPATMLAYGLTDNRWRRLPLPTEAGSSMSLVAAGSRLVAFRISEEGGGGPDLVLDAVTNIWEPLPPDPLSAAFDRTMVWSSEGLVLFDREIVPSPGSGKPAVTRAALFDPSTRSWRRLPDSQILSAYPWIADGSTLVNPTLGGADGGVIHNWGRTYANGGSLDVVRNRWSLLPEAPAEATQAAGVLTATSGLFTGPNGWVLDTERGRWFNVPAFVDAMAGTTDPTVVTAGRSLFLFGGAVWRDGEPGRVTDDAWIWVPITAG